MANAREALAHNARGLVQISFLPESSFDFGRQVRAGVQALLLKIQSAE